MTAGQAVVCELLVAVRLSGHAPWGVNGLMERSGNWLGDLPQLGQAAQLVHRLGYTY
jgi:hypothetical protein